MWLDTTNLRSEVAKKLGKRRDGPFSIIQVVSPVAYKLKLPKRMGRLHKVFHVKHLSEVKEDPNQPIKYAEPGPLYEEDGEQYFEPEALLNKRTVRGQLQYRVQWKGHPNWHNSWEAADSLKKTIPEMIVAYDLLHQHKTSKTGRRRRKSNS